MKKTTVFNLIILDESGSMCGARKSTIDGCNETINVARTLQKENADHQRSFISIFAFDSDMAHSRYICKNADVETVSHISEKDYCPNGTTPLFDAVGSTLVDLRAVAATHEDALGVVTIITDGAENSSETYTPAMLRKLIGELREKGWTINLIGANIDLADYAEKMNINSCMSFDNSSEGTQHMFSNFNRNYLQAERERVAAEADMDEVERVSYRAKRSFFKD